MVGKCLWFDGDDDYVEIPDTDDLDLTHDFTIAAWIKPITYGETNNGRIIDHGGGAPPSNGWAFHLDNITGKERLMYQYNNASNRPSDDNTVALNSWQHVVMIHEGSDAKFFIDGIQKGSTNGVSYPSDSSDPIRIGIRASDLNRDFHGFIDEVKIYPYARSAAQIKADYNAGLSGMKTNKGSALSVGGGSDKWMSDGLVGYWKFDESATTSGAVDSSGNGNDLSYENFNTISGGKFGNNLYWNGTNSRLTRVANNYTNVGGNLSAVMWIKATTGNGRGLVSYGMTGAIAGNWEFCNDDAVLFFRDWPNGGSAQLNQANMGADLTDGAWHQVAVTRMSNGTIKFYYDGGNEVTVKGQAGQMNNAQSTKPFHIGDCENGTSGGPWLDYLDEVRIYNRALSKSEVKKLYEWAPGPVGYWDFNEDQGIIAHDKSGNLNDFSFTGTPEWVKGKYMGALELDGSTESSSINDANLSDNFPGKNGTGKIYGFTISTWVNLDAYSDDLLCKYSSSWCLWVPVDGTLKEDKTGTVTTEQVPLNKWVYLTMTFDGSYVRLYFNGIEKAKKIKTTPFNDSSNSISLGNAGDRLDGKVDDLKIYNYARTQKQILEDMNGGAGAGRAAKSPLLHLSFDEGYGDIAHDESSQRNNGTLQSVGGGTNDTNTKMWSLSGKYGGVMEFDGTDDYVAMGSLLDLSGSDMFTVSAWIKPSNVNRLENIIEIGSANGHAVWENTTGGFYGGTVFGTSGWTTVTSANNTLKANEWQHIIYSYDGSKQRLYLNTEEIKSNSIAEAFATPSGTFQIGKGGGGSTFTGLMDEIKIWNYALGEDEIKQEYNRGSSLSLGVTKSENNNGSTVTGNSAQYCVPGDTAQCDAPVMHLRMDENSGTVAYDVSGNGNDGTLGGGTASYQPAWTRGKMGNALQFDGYDDEVYGEDILDGLSEITVSSWVKWDTSDMNDGRAFVVVKDYAFMLRPIDAGHKFLFAIHNGSSWYESNNTLSDIDDGSWHYVTGVYDGQYVRIYVDGVQENNNNVGSMTTASNSNIIEVGGANYNWASQHWNWNGWIDDVRIYDYARTPAQIAWEYNRGKPVAEYRFDECQGTVAHDESGNGNHGTINIGSAGTQTTPGTCASSSAASAWYNGVNGKRNYSLGFDGNDDYVTISDSSLLSPANEITISLWFKRSTMASDRVLIRKSETNQRSWILQLDYEAGEGMRGGKICSV